ncbi:2OG-Fe(II) oxygenase [Yoonia sp. SS1-5]|uniref:2OG-Fe(II) oxygenase n=1 Tax=Yoonia rhodophyticola TaxID=3137370 RepID=A0AAN0MBE8_9RHOB
MSLINETIGSLRGPFFVSRGFQAADQSVIVVARLNVAQGHLMQIEDIVDMATYPIADAGFAATCNTKLDADGVLVLPDFIQAKALADIQAEAVAKQDQAYFCAQDHSVYLTPDNPAFGADHPANRKVTSSKGCICDDVIAGNSPLRALYDDVAFRRFVARTTGQAGLYPYADNLSSINIHYAKRGQELGWHFDNSSFAITLLIQKPAAGSRFEYIKDLRDADAGDLNYTGVAALLDGATQPDVLAMDPGTLVLFRGRNSIHRVSPNESDITRMLAVLAYNAEPDVSLSESARMTFYGRLD